MAIFNRLPSRGQVASVYAVAVLLFYGWTFGWFLWKLPSWLYYLSLDKIFSILAYSNVTNLLESLLVVALPVVLHVILPRKWFGEAFVARSVTLVLLGGLSMFYLLNQFQTREDYPSEAVRLIPLLFLAILALSILAGIPARLRWILENFAERATIFLYVSIPVSLVSLVAVLARLLV